MGSELLGELLQALLEVLAGHFAATPLLGGAARLRNLRAQGVVLLQEHHSNFAERHGTLLLARSCIGGSKQESNPHARLDIARLEGRREGASASSCRRIGRGGATR